MKKYQKLVVMPLGIIAIAESPDEYRSLSKFALWLAFFWMGSFAAMALSLIVFMIVIAE